MAGPMGLLGQAAGTGKGFADLIAQRLIEAKFDEEKRAAGAREKLAQDTLSETRRSREATERETERRNREMERDRADRLDAQQFNVRLASLQPGNEVDETERQYMLQHGLSPASFDIAGSDPAARHPLGPHAPGGSDGVYGPPDSAFEGPDEKPAPGPLRWRYQGKTADRLRQEGIASTEETAALNRQNQLTMAQLAAASREAAAAMRGGRSQWDEPAVMLQDPSSGATIPVPRSIAYDPMKAREYIDNYRRNGLQGTQTAGTREKVDAYKTTLRMANEIQKLGDEIGWEGLGGFGMGDVKRGLKRGLGVGSDKAETLRNMIDRLRSQASFQEGGKQFTGTEAALIDNFLTGVNSDPKTAKLRLRSFGRQVADSLRGLNVDVNSIPELAPYLQPEGGAPPGAMMPPGAEHMMRSTPGGGQPRPGGGGQQIGRYKVTILGQ